MRHVQRRWMAWWAALVAGGVIVGAQGGGGFVITNARLFDPAAGRIRDVAAVLVEGTKVSAVHDAAPAGLPAGIRQVDAKRATILPALSDLSVQVAASVDLDRDFFHALSLAHGVMRVRAIDGRLPMAIDDRARIRSGEVLAPRTWVAGPVIDMRRPMGQAGAAVLAGGLTPVQQVDDAAAAVRAAQAQWSAGADWVRLGGHATPAVVSAVTRAARTKRAKVSAEARASSMLQLAQARVTLIDGLGLPVKGQADLEAASKSRPEPPTTAVTMNDAAWAQLSPAEMKNLVAVLVRTRTAVAPMLRAADAQREDGPKDELDLLPDRTRGSVMGRVSKAVTKIAQERRARARTQRMAFVKALAEAGGTIVLASGAASDGYPAPGLAVHKELALLVEAGLTPAQAWKAAAASGALLLGDSGRQLQILANAPADFFLVTGDPLKDVGVVSAITLLVRNGEILERAQLVRTATRARGIVR